MSIFDKIYQKAQASPQTIVLPEGDEPRVIQAASLAAQENLAKIIILGEPDAISRLAKKNNFDISKITLVNPREDKSLDDYVKSYWNLRKYKGITIQYARDLLLRDSVFFGAMMLREGRANGFVAGAVHTTSDVARACLHCIERSSGHSTVSGAFLIEIKQRQYGQEGLLLFADCGIVPTPSAAQLADIALASAELWRKVTGYDARVAMLSFSTKGSSSSESVELVRGATEIAKKIQPDLLIDGELQVDSAVEPEVARLKVPQSPLGGRANILIFPNLDAGNIAYKLMQRLAQARVVGPLIQGLVLPCSDLSRGASSQEIMDAIAVTAVRAQ